MKNKYLLITFILFLGLSNCDSQKKNNLLFNDKQFACYVLAICSEERGVKFGMIGDSWTDLLFGTNFIETLRVQLEKYHGYKLIGSTQGGETIDGVLKKGSHLRVIDKAGPSLKYMLISIGGNDLQRDPEDFITNEFETEKTYRLNKYKKDLKNMIASGNAYKLSKFGGEPLLWIIHGYDFASTDNEVLESSTTTCRTTLLEAGWTDAQINGTDLVNSLPNSFNEFNELLRNTTTEEPGLRYVDLRYTLGASASNNYSSNPSLYIDCIHPNSVGFRILGEKYAKILQGYTNNER
jgi:hypothetical protein